MVPKRYVLNITGVWWLRQAEDQLCWSCMEAAIMRTVYCGIVLIYMLLIGSGKCPNHSIGQKRLNSLSHDCLPLLLPASLWLWTDYWPFYFLTTRKSLWIIIRFNFEYNSKVGDHSRGWLEGSLFDSYYTKV